MYLATVDLRFLDHEWYDALPATWVVSELFTIVSVFAESPDCHLVESSHAEQCSWETLSHDTEADPRADLVRIVGT